MAQRQPATVAELLRPRSVAVIGASEDQTKFGGRLYRLLLKHGFEGAVYPINPNRAELFGIKTFPDLKSTPQPADLVVMAVPRRLVAPVIGDAAAMGVKGGIIITSKFSDEGPEGAALERQIVATARAGGMRLIGPNCLGMISPANKVVLCSSPALDAEVLPVGPIGFASQSGAMMATVFDRARARGVGFSHCVSVGNQADLELCDFVEYFLDDERTRVVCTYVEGLKDPARFVALARRARAMGKPWLMVKAGRTESGARAAFSHTASLAGSFAALEAVCRETGVVLLDDFDAMTLLAASLARYPGRVVQGATLITTSGGGGAITADRLAAAGIPLTRFAEATEAALGEHYSPGQASNPIDFGGRTSGESVDIADVTMSLVGADPARDAVLAVLTTSPDMRRTTAGIADAAPADGKPLVFVMTPGAAADAARAELVARGAPFTDTVDDAVRALRGWVDYCAFAPPEEAVRPEGLPASPMPMADGVPGLAALAALLEAYGLPVAPQAVCATAAAAVAAAGRIGYPVAVKAVGAAIVHKTEAGGVVLNLADGVALEAAVADLQARLGGDLEAVLVQRMTRGEVELIVGVSHDEQFGPMVVVGAGGILVELLHDVAMAPAPLSAAAATALLGRLKVAALLRGIRGRPALDIAAVVDTVVRVGWLAHDLRGILRELDINPLMVGVSGCTVVDARALISSK